MAHPPAFLPEANAARPHVSIEAKHLPTNWE